MSPRKVETYQSAMLNVFEKIEAKLTTGFNTCVTKCQFPNVAQVRKGKVYGNSNNIEFDPDRFFAALERTLPPGDGRGFLVSQPSALLHELSHSANAADLRRLGEIPGPFDNPGNIRDPKFQVQLTAEDSYFIQRFADNSAASVAETLIMPFLYVLPGSKANQRNRRSRVLAAPTWAVPQRIWACLSLRKKRIRRHRSRKDEHRRVRGR